METHTIEINCETFNASQYLPKEFGHCHNLHGHTYLVKNLYAVTDRIVDFSIIKKVIDQFDHCTIAPEKDRDFWEAVSKIENAPVIFKMRYIPYEMGTVEYIALHLKKMITEIPGVIDVYFELYETPNQGTVI